MDNNLNYTADMIQQNYMSPMQNVNVFLFLVAAIVSGVVLQLIQFRSIFTEI